jgi:hypothetical protein
MTTQAREGEANERTNRKCHDDQRRQLHPTLPRNSACEATSPILSQIATKLWSACRSRERGRLHVNRVKGGQEAVHPLHGPELRALRPLQGQSPYVFVTEQSTARYTALAPDRFKGFWKD